MNHVRRVLARLSRYRISGNEKRGQVDAACPALSDLARLDKLENQIKYAILSLF